MYKAPIPFFIPGLMLFPLLRLFFSPGLSGEAVIYLETA